MEIPNYVPMGSARGRDIKTGEWVYGWHWSNIVDCTKVTHYIKTKNGEDIEVKDIGFFIGNRDNNRVPLFLGDKVEFEFLNTKFEGIICYNCEECAYVIKCGKEEFHFGKIDVYKS